jgi:hypothetical protein
MWTRWEGVTVGHAPLDQVAWQEEPSKVLKWIGCDIGWRMRCLDVSWFIIIHHSFFLFFPSCCSLPSPVGDIWPAVKKWEENERERVAWLRAEPMRSNSHFRDGSCWLRCRFDDVVDVPLRHSPLSPIAQIGRVAVAALVEFSMWNSWARITRKGFGSFLMYYRQLFRYFCVSKILGSQTSYKLLPTTRQTRCTGTCIGDI